MRKNKDFEQQTSVKLNVMSREKKRLLFYALIMAYPLLQVAVFYVYQNFSSILLAFQKHNVDYVEGVYTVTTTFENFGLAWNRFINSGQMVKNSFVMFLIAIVVSMNLAIIFSYYIYKQCPGAGIFKLALFMPQMVSGVVFVMLFRYITDDVYREIMVKISGDQSIKGLLSNPETQLGVVIFYNVWVSFGTNVLMYTGTMSGINESVVESAQLDGANILQEFIYITFPNIYSTYVTFLIVQMASIFTSNMNLHTFFGSNSLYKTIGYDIYINTLEADVFVEAGSPLMPYPVISAYGLILTLIVAPVTIVIRKALEKLGPSTN